MTMVQCASGIFGIWMGRAVFQDCATKKPKGKKDISWGEEVGARGEGYASSMVGMQKQGT